MKSKLKIVILLIVCTMKLYSLDNGEAAKSSSMLISAKKGGEIILDDVRIEIPANALSKDTEISITRLSEVQKTGDTIENVTEDKGGYRFLPAGTKFKKDVLVYIPYNPSLNAKPAALDNLYTYYFDTIENKWIALERVNVDKEKCIVISKTNHFTDMINATLVMPETPDAVDVNLNSIKNLEAAKPDSHVVQFNPPQVNNYGDSGFSFNLDIPYGRNGVQPQLLLNYSSSGGNGLLGKGFDINYGSMICIDTRKKLPDYNETDVYLLDGILMEAKAGNIEYRLKKRSGYLKITRYNAWSEDENEADYWEVKSSDGTTRIFGKTADSTLGSKSSIFTWYCSKIIDKNGNSIVFEYEKNDGNYVRPKRIKYTGNEKQEEPVYKYTIDFEYETRNDVRTDARSRTLVSCNKRLKSIKAYNDGVLFREYDFIYKEGFAKESLLEKFRVSNGKDYYDYDFAYIEPQIKDGQPQFFGEQKQIFRENSSNKSLFNYSLFDTENASSGGNISVGGGVGFGTSVGDIRATGGGTGSTSQGTTSVVNTFADLNGDGRLDSIRIEDNEVTVLLKNETGYSKKSIKGYNFKKFKLNEEKNSNDSGAWNVYLGLGANDDTGVGGSYSRNSQSGTTKLLNCIMDVDGDGLADFIIDNKTYLHNEGKEENGALIFTKKEIVNFPENSYRRRIKRIQKYL